MDKLFWILGFFFFMMLIGNKAWGIEVDKQTECLALNIYYEARSSSLADKVAVADVVLNRVESNKFPNTVCSVVKQGRYYKGTPVRNKCQFSWFCDGKKDTPLDLDAWEEAKLIAFKMYHYLQYRGISEKSTHYHADYVKPFWAKHYQLVGTIGRHKYYRGK